MLPPRLRLRYTICDASAARAMKRGHGQNWKKDRHVGRTEHVDCSHRKISVASIAAQLRVLDVWRERLHATTGLLWPPSLLPKKPKPQLRRDCAAQTASASQTIATYSFRSIIWYKANLQNIEPKNGFKASAPSTSAARRADCR